MADIDIKLLQELDNKVKALDGSFVQLKNTLSSVSSMASNIGEKFLSQFNSINSISSPVNTAAHSLSLFMDSMRKMSMSAKNEAAETLKSFSGLSTDLMTVASNLQKSESKIGGALGLSKFEIEKFDIQKVFNNFPETIQRLKSLFTEWGSNIRGTVSDFDSLRDKIQRIYELSKDVKEVYGDFVNGEEVDSPLDDLKKEMADLQVMSMTGLIDSKQFNAEADNIISKYEELKNERKEYESVGDVEQVKKNKDKALKIQQKNYEAIKKKEDELADIQRQRSIREKKYAKDLTPEVKQKLKDVYDAEELRIKTLQKEIRQLAKERRDAAKISGVSNSSAAARGTGDQASTKRELESKKRLLNATRQLEEAETRAAEKRHRQALQASRDFNTITSTVRKLAAALGLTASLQGIANFGRKLIEVRGEFELQQVALRSILQNKQLADEIWDKTMQAALQSPFTAMQLTTYTKQLAAYRIETEKLFDTTKRLADVSAGLGVDIQRLILAYGQVKAANYLRASEIRQFTEAGVNILGELSTYLSSTRGELISTAKVMDMVQKRMVTFADVEAIFKRMTDAGGIFYNMQYVQSQTVKGQINKLHDAYDQMLNSIGKANTGALRNMVSLLLNIVKNWREWKTVLDSIAIPALTIAVIKFAKGLFTTGASARIASKEIHGLALAGTKARLSLAALKRTMVGFKLGGAWGAVGITAAIVAITALVNRYKAVKAINDEIDEHNVRLYETKLKLEDYQTTIEKNNASLKDSVGTESSLAEKRKQNSEILAKLKSDYPQLVEGIEQQKNGVINLTDAIKKENEELEKQITLNSLMKNNNPFNENFTEDAEDLAKAYIEQQQAIIDARANAVKQLIQLEQSGQKDSEVYRIIKQISEINPDNIQKASEELKNLGERLNGIIYGLNANVKSNALNRLLIPKSTLNILDFYNEYISDVISGTKLSKAEQNASEEFGKLGNTIGYYLAKGLEESYGDEIQKSGLSTMQWYAINVAKVQKDVDDGVKDVYRFLREALVNNGQAEAPGMKEFWNSLVKKNYVDPYFNAWKQGMDEAEAGGWRFPMPLPTEGNTPNVFAQKTKDSENPFLDDDKNKKGKKSAEQLISLIREMRAEYDKLSKSAYGYTLSEEKVRDAYRQSVREILNKANVTEEYDFTTNEGMIAALRNVKDYAQKLGPEAAAEVEKYIGQLQSEIDINAQVRIREDLGRQIEKAFGDYELTLDLHKLNLPAGLAEELWNVEDVDLSDLRAKVSNMFDELKDKKGELTADAIKDYENYLKKIDDLERKQQRERLKEYSKYLEYQYSERTKIEMDYVSRLSQLEASAIPEPQKKDIRTGIRREYEEALKKQDWEDFKGSEFYVQMMEDLGKQGSASLELMRDKLKEMRDNAENLSPRALKEVVNALEKIDEIERSRTAPLQRLRTATEEINTALNKNNLESINQAYEALAINQKTVAEKEKQAKEVERMIMLENERQRLERSGYDVESLRPEEAERILESYRAKAFKAQNDLAAFRSDGTKESEQTRANLEEAANREQRLVELWQSIVEVIKGGETITSLQKSSEFYGMSESDLKKRRDDLKDEIKQLQKQGNKYNELVQKIKELQLAWNATFESIKDWGQRVSSVFNDVMDTVEFFEDSTYGLTAAWKEFGNETYNTLNDLITGIQEFKSAQIELQKLQEGSDAAKALMSGSYVKIALMLLGVILKIVQAVAKLNDNYKNAEIERQQEKVDSLTRAYERLERQIEKTFESTKYMRTYNEQLDNLRQQIAAFEAQRAAEEAKKNTDRNAVNGYTDAIEDAYDKIEELKERQLELFGGIGESGYRDAAQAFVEAWKSAFLETGDGLSGLQQHFDEFLQDWFVKQATMQGVAKYYKKVFDYINGVVEDGNVPTYQQIEAARQLADEAAVQSDAFMQALAGVFGNFGGDGSLSGLAAGIQGITEEQANVLEAYWNSVRMYAASIDGNVSRIAEMLGANGVESNPMLQQMSLIAANTQATHQLLQTVVKSGHPQGGYGVKVFND